ncbi:MAG: 50S ribosomal protein L4, partial [Mycoplasmataceae bacterium]|nr:50S ribosomal protein L4 [Mycoplasmataceae bacterium]
QGSTRNPQWKGGGVAFGPKPTRNYKLKVNAKVSRIAFLSVFTEKFGNKLVCCIDNVNMVKPKTNAIKSLILSLIKNAILHYKNNKTKTNILFAIDGNNDNGKNFIKSTNNLHDICTKDSKYTILAKKWHSVSVKDMVWSDYLVIQKSVFEDFIKKCGGME